MAIKIGRMDGNLECKKLFKSFYVFSMLACFVSLCAHMFYMLAVLKDLTCLCASLALFVLFSLHLKS